MDLFFLKVLKFNSRSSIEILNFENGGGVCHSMLKWLHGRSFFPSTMSFLGISGKYQ